VLSCYESSMREKQWAVHKQFLLLPVKTSPALMHNMISLLKHDLWDALNLLLCTPNKQCAFISSLIIMRVSGQGCKMKTLRKWTSFIKKCFAWINIYDGNDLSILSHDPFTGFFISFELWFWSHKCQALLNMYCLAKMGQKCVRTEWIKDKAHCGPLEI